MAMATNVHQQTWVPYVPTKDCSLGFCSIYCPQWCYIIFPPPPPVEFSGDSSGVTFSPLVIAIIGILAGAFLLVCYYTIVTKYCGTFASLRRWFNPPGRDDRDLDDSIVGQSHRHEAWHGSPWNGLDEALISKITVYRYRRGDGMVQGTDCSVCLGEFREDDSLRLLPKCSHAFHLQCIDIWLRSHSNCPLCRANIVSVNPTAPPPPPPLQLQAAPESESNPEVEEVARVDEMVVVIEDAGVSSEEEAEPGSSGNSAKDSSQIYRDSRGVEEVDAIVKIRDDDIQPIRRSFSMDATNCGRVSIADVLQMTMEDELLAAKEGGFWAGASSSRRVAGDHNKVRRSQESRGLHGVMSPVRMKRSFSNERFCLTRHAKGRNGLLPGQGASE